MVNKHRRAIFILGCERSGSTWLSNIVDAHPEVIFFMEPFADYASIFPGFPHRNFYLDIINDEFVLHISELFERLPYLKYNFFSKPQKPHYYKSLDKWYVNTTSRMLKLLKLGHSTRATSYNLLNLNKKDESSTIMKRNLPFNDLFMVVKELRLNFKVCLIQKMYPNVKILVTLRNPGAQLGSIIRLLNSGGLSELCRSLLLFKEYIISSPRFNRYSKLVQDFDQRSMVERLIIWWLINYEVLLEDLDAFDVPHLVVYHEDLCEDCMSEVSKIFEFCEIPMSEGVKNYVSQSTVSSNNAWSVVDTHRNSKDYYKDQIDKVDSNLRNKISQILGSIDHIRPEMAHYHNQY